MKVRETKTTSRQEEERDAVEVLDAYLKTHRLTAVVALRRKRGEDIQRQDFYAFKSLPEDRALSRAKLEIIADEIDLPLDVVEASYLGRGGVLARNTREERRAS